MEKCNYSQVDIRPISNRDLNKEDNQYLLLIARRKDAPTSLTIGKVYSKTISTYEISTISVTPVGISGKIYYNIKESFIFYDTSCELYNIYSIQKDDYDLYVKLLRIGQNDHTWHKSFIDIIKQKYSHIGLIYDNIRTL